MNKKVLYYVGIDVTICLKILHPIIMNQKPRKDIVPGQK